MEAALLQAEELPFQGKDGGPLHEHMRTLGARRMFDTLRRIFLESSRADARALAFKALEASAEDEKAAAILAELASRDSMSIDLAIYRSGGEEYLLSLVEDPAARMATRLQALNRLRHRGTKVALDKLGALEGAAEVVLLPAGQVGEPPPTLGQVVRRYRADIARRLGAR